MEATYSIRQVIDLSGVSEYLLRIWELRYAAFRPHRTPTGRRVYGKEDILKARALFELRQRGHRIRELAPLSLLELRRLLEAGPPPGDLPDPPEVQRGFQCILKHQWKDLGQILTRVQKKHQGTGWIHVFLLPLIAQVSRGVATKEISISQEHIFSSMVRGHLQKGTTHRRRPHERSRMVFATPEGDFHELGLMVAAHMASLSHQDVLYMGPHMPKRDLCEVLIRYRATHLILASTINETEGAKEDFLAYLHFVIHHAPPKLRLWLAGRNALELEATLHAEPRLRIFKNFTEFEQEVRHAK